MIDCIIQTCKRDWTLANIAAAGLRKFWPEARPILLVDDDRSTEIPLPDDIREMVRKIPYLRRQLEFTRFAETEMFAILDSDCLCYKRPVELESLAFQGNPGGGDRDGVVKVWKSLGYDIPHQDVRFCAGMYTATQKMYRDTGLMFAYLRRCMEMGYDQGDYPAVVCEQGMASGLWRMNYPHNPLPADLYPFARHVEGCSIWHTSSFREQWANDKIETYTRMVGYGR